MFVCVCVYIYILYTQVKNTKPSMWHHLPVSFATYVALQQRVRQLRPRTSCTTTSLCGIEWVFVCLCLSYHQFLLLSCQAAQETASMDAADAEEEGQL